MKPVAKRILTQLGVADLVRRMYYLVLAQQAHVVQQVSAWIWYRGIPKLPIPSSELITLVAGRSDVTWFLAKGHLGAKTIVDILQENGIAMNSLDKVLDFGCGCGRVIRYMSIFRCPKFFGTDYNPQLIEWCQHNLSFASFGVNQLEPPLAYSDEEFDLIYAFSVFTHLPERLQKDWIGELKRILRPGGYLMISTHGEYYLHRLQPQAQAEFLAGRLVIQDAHLAGTNFCAAFHPPQYVRSELAKGFAVVDFIKEGAKGNPYQDVFLLRK